MSQYQTSYNTVLSQGTGSYSYWWFYTFYQSSTQQCCLCFYAINGIEPFVNVNYWWIEEQPVWHHVVGVKKGNEYGIYLDGLQVGHGISNTTVTFNAPLNIGSMPGYNINGLCEGHMDELRIQHSNAFLASPNSGKTDTIIVPTKEYEKPTNIDSSNTDFQLQYDPVPGTIQLFLNGVIQDDSSGGEYEISGRDINFIKPPRKDSNLKASYFIE